MTDLNSLETNARMLVDKAAKAGADACDVVIARSRSLSTSVRERALENSELSEHDRVSLRVFCGARFASVGADTNSDLDQLAERAVAMARVSPEDPSQGMADPGLLMDTDAAKKAIASLEMLDDQEPDAKHLETLALEAEAGGLAVDGVAKSMGAGAGWSSSGFVLATSTGFTGSHSRSSYTVSAAMLAGEGTAMERDYEYDMKTHFGDLLDAGEIGRRAGERTVRRLGARQVKSGVFPVVFDPRLSASIVSTLASAINGSAVARKTSFLKDRMGEQICKSGTTIVDDPRMPRLSGSRAFDGEGVEASPLTLVDDGELQCWLLDSVTGRELGMATNGRASRAGGSVSPATTNCYLEAGSDTPEAMISSIKSGLYLSETIGHGINMVTGDYSKGAAGFWIENGEIAYPVAEITVAGNLADMFMNMTPANDLAFRFRTNAPTLLIEGMTIGGL